MRRLLLTLVAIALCSRATAIAGEEPAIEWRPWSDSVFASDGGFRHDEEDVAGPYLGDTLSMGRAFLTLYACTADRAWLNRAEQAAKFIATNFPLHRDQLLASGLFARAADSKIVSKRPNMHSSAGLLVFGLSSEAAPGFIS